MLRLIWYQFLYSKKQWLGTIPLLFTASLIIGVSLIGTTSSSSSIVAAPIQLFQMLLIFGGTTLFFLISNIIRLLMNIFQQDHQLWTILGANKKQLSLLVSGQFFLMALIISIFGTFLAFLVVDDYYSFLQFFLGQDELPNLFFNASFLTFIISSLIVPTIVGFGAYFYSLRFLEADKQFENRPQKKKILHLITKLINILLVATLWVLCAFYITSDVSDRSPEQILPQSSGILYLLILHLFIIQIISPQVQILALRIIHKFFNSKHYAYNTGFWNLLQNPNYLKSLQTSLTMGVTLTSGFMIFTQNMYVFAGTENAIYEARASFIAYMLAPILLILANTISISIISSNQDFKEIIQLQILGTSKQQLLKIRLTESIFHASIIILVSTIFNFIIIYFVHYIAKLFGQGIIAYSGLWLPSLTILISIIVFYMVIKGIFIIKNKI
ncbi:beta-carotene 15,15'-monooxygenase [Streptococcus sp. NLN76]|uniref:beta-carotene 15,15'-monooxygenase n=1 Tax=Streptococcus sp. NLN76 TaxID=2822800 RepID=UPI0018ABED63|nr:beta-carotene 15,15'-monooxygenase [Streptococcus sp. NLN76]MBF8969529.1 beta-carotene 15,15'-monooxygenase [Streptococcus sp. NLN76]